MRILTHKSVNSHAVVGLYDLVGAQKLRQTFVRLEEQEHRGEKSKPEFDPGTKSEGEEDSMGGKKGLGRTPNHLTLSTTSTLSAGSTGSQAKLIQSSHHPEHYQPSQVKDLGK